MSSEPLGGDASPANWRRRARKRGVGGGGGEVRCGRVGLAGGKPTGAASNCCCGGAGWDGGGGVCRERQPRLSVSSAALDSFSLRCVGFNPRRLFGSGSLQNSEQQKRQRDLQPRTDFAPSVGGVPNQQCSETLKHSSQLCSIRLQNVLIFNSFKINTIKRLRLTFFFSHCFLI